nr:alpha/beta fold hydrolase [Legionella adelaidensis]
MSISDFRFMWRGKHVEVLKNEHANLLDNIAIHTGKKERALLLLHGFSSSPAVFRALVPSLPNYDTIVCPSLPGHAQNLLAFSQSTYQDWIKASEEFCEKLTKEYKKVDVLGLSLGGVLACHLSEQFALNHLYLLAPALALRININLALKLTTMLKGLGLRYVRNRAGNLRSNTYKELAYRQLPLNSIMQILKLIKSFNYEQPKCPTDLFLGALDEVVDSQKVASLFKDNPQVKIHWLYESAHVLPLDGELDAIIKTVQENFS